MVTQITKREFEELPTEMKVEILNKIIKGEVKIIEVDIPDFLQEIFA